MGVSSFIPFHEGGYPPQPFPTPLSLCFSLHPIEILLGSPLDAKVFVKIFLFVTAVARLIPDFGPGPLNHEAEHRMA